MPQGDKVADPRPWKLFWMSHDAFNILSVSGIDNVEIMFEETIKQVNKALAVFCVVICGTTSILKNPNTDLNMNMFQVKNHIVKVPRRNKGRTKVYERLTLVWPKSSTRVGRDKRAISLHWCCTNWSIQRTAALLMLIPWQFHCRPTIQVYSHVDSNSFLQVRQPVMYFTRGPLLRSGSPQITAL